ncbi:MAG: Hsp20 family protein, partial [Pseudomonadota bacterium]
MTRANPPRGPLFSNPLLLGFDEIDRLLEQISKSGNDGYPPYNVEQIIENGEVALIRITLAVAGFREDDLDVTIEENQLIIRGKQEEEPGRTYLHRGIA